MIVFVDVGGMVGVRVGVDVAVSLGLDNRPGLQAARRKTRIRNQAERIV